MIPVAALTFSSLSSASQPIVFDACKEDLPSAVVKKKEDQILTNSPFCGQLIVVSTPKDNPNLDVAVAINIRPTKAHFHKHFQEIYMVLDGMLTLELYDPNTDKVSNVILEANELAMIPPGVHHRISEASGQNRLQVICQAGFLMFGHRTQMSIDAK